MSESRLLSLLTLLQIRPSWSGTELSERLKVTSRTLRRDAERASATWATRSTARPDAVAATGSGVEVGCHTGGG